MPPDPDRPPRDDVPRDAEANLAALRQLATASRAGQSSWLARTFGSAKSTNLGVALVDALERQIADFRKTIETQNTRLGQIERELTELRALADGFRELRGRLGNAENEMVQAREKSERIQRELREKITATAEELRQEIGPLFAGQTEQRDQLQHMVDEQREQIQQIRDEQRDQIQRMADEQRGRIQQMADEQRDQIQQIVNEQRVSIRQILLKTSEDAVLADRARRALELRLDALEQAGPAKPKK